LGTKRPVRLACGAPPDASPSVGPGTHVEVLAVTMPWSAAKPEGVARSASPISPGVGPVWGGMRAMRQAGHATVAFSRVGLFNALGLPAYRIGPYPLTVLAQEFEDALVGTWDKSAPTSSRRPCQRRSCILTLSNRTRNKTDSPFLAVPLFQCAALLRHV